MRTIREALAAIRQAPVLTGLSTAMVALALFVVGLFAVATYNLHHALDQAHEGVALVLQIQDDSLAIGLGLLQEDRLGQPGAAGEMRQDGREGELSAGRGWIGRLSLLSQIGGIITGILGTAFAVVAGLIIATAVRIGIFARRDEIRSLKLQGATRGFIARPFLLEGAIMGLLGGVLALGMTYLGTAVVSRTLFQLTWIPAMWTVGGVASGGLFGLLASAFALSRHLEEV